MADWSDISDLWWLQHRQDAGNFGRGLALGAQVAQQREENTLRQQQATMLMDQKRAALQTQEAKARGISAMSSYMAEVAARNAWTDPAAEAGFYRLGSQFPQAIDDPTLQAMAKNFDSAKARAEQANRHERTAPIMELEKANLYDQFAKEIEKTHPDLAAQYTRDAALLRGRQYGPTETYETVVGPDGQVTTRLIRGPTGAPKDPGALTGAVQSDLQRKAFTSEDAVRSGLNLLGQINSETVGPLATFKSFALDKGLANIDPKFANPERIEARQGFRIWAENAIAAMKKDSQLNVPEEKRMLQAMSLLDTFTSPAEGKVQTAGFIRTMQDVTRQANLRQGKPIPQLAWNEKEIQAALTEGIVSGFKSGITKERAIELLTNLKAIEDARANK